MKNRTHLILGGTRIATPLLKSTKNKRTVFRNIFSAFKENLVLNIYIVTFLIFLLPFPIWADGLGSELYRQYVSGEISSQNPSLLASKQIRQLGEANIVLSTNWESFNTELYQPFINLNHSLGYQFFHGRQAFYNPLGLASLVYRPFEILGNYPEILEDLRQFREMPLEEIDKPINLKNSGHFKSGWHFIIGLASFLKEPRNFGAIKFSGVAISRFGSEAKLRDAFQHLRTHGNLSNWNPSATDAQSILLTHQWAEGYSARYKIGGVPVKPVFHPILLESPVMKSTLMRILGDDSNPERQRAVVQDIARYFYYDKELPTGKREEALTLEAFGILKGAFSKLGNISFVSHVYESAPPQEVLVSEVIDKINKAEKVGRCGVQIRK